jgi:hypothetical protein
MGRGRYAKMAEKMNDYSTKQTKNWVIEPKKLQHNCIRLFDENSIGSKNR